MDFEKSTSSFDTKKRKGPRSYLLLNSSYEFFKYILVENLRVINCEFYHTTESM